MVSINELSKFQEKKNIPDFNVGDTVKVSVKIIEGDKERSQIFEGIVIARRKKGIESTFTVRKISYGEGVERIFPVHSPRVESVKVIKKGKVRRAKLFYLRDRSDKMGRIKEG
ncbi:50S ribosomal protein L19 [PVC group bacterium]|nr:50S ribosomal protein L19 [PVC group bacterium]